MSLCAGFGDWALQARQGGLEKGVEEVLEKGRTEGAARILQRLLVARFGPLSQETQAALSTASTAQLEAWTDRFLSARTLDEVFAAPTSPSA